MTLGSLIGIAALAGAGWMLFVLAAILSQADPLSLLVIALVFGYVARGVWRWLTAPVYAPAFAIHTERGVPPQHKPEVSPRTSLDDLEEDEEWSG